MSILKSKNSLPLIAVLTLLVACGGESAPQEAAASMTFPTAALVDPNSASAEELAAVPGMTEAAAAAIMTGRPFATPTEMNTAIGDTLDDEGRKSVYAHVFVKVGLNSGAEDDYKLIPSSLRPGHLAHEFEEYRPFESMEQFSREMSKYVSAEEVVYLQRFVTLD